MSLFNFPNQRIPESKKTKDWYFSHIINYVSYAQSKDYAEKKKEIEELFYAYSAIISPEQKTMICKTITERFGEGQNLGPEYVIYPLCETLVEHLIAEYRLRPLKRRCFANNEHAIIKKFDLKIDMLTEKIIREANQELSQTMGLDIESENPDLQIPENIEEFISKDYRTIAEEISEDVLYQMLVVHRDKEKVYDYLRYFLIAGRVFGLPINKDGHPSLFVPHLLDCFYDIDPQDSVQKNINYFVYDKYMTINDIFNEFQELTEEQMRAIEAYSNYDDKDRTKSNQAFARNLWFKQEDKDHRVRVVTMRWISKKKLRFKEIVTSEGLEEMKVLKDDDKVKTKEKDKVQTIYPDVERFVTVIGPDIILDWGEAEHQLQRVSAPNKRFLDVVGIIDQVNNGTGEIRSLVKKIKFLQDFASEIMYELRLAIRQIDGNILGYDLDSIPKEWAKLGINVLDKVNFHLKRDRIKYYNSKQTKGNTNAAVSNISNKGRTQDLLTLLIAIEDVARKIAGVSRERQGEANQYEKATVAQMNQTNSTISTEKYFGPFDSFLETLLERSVMKAKTIYKKGDVFSYIAGDAHLKFLKISDDFFLEDIGIHINDNRKEFERANNIDQIARETFAAGQAAPEIMLQLMKLMNAEDSSEKIAIFERGVKQLEIVRQENNKALQAEAEAKVQEAQLKEEKLDERHKDTLQNNIDVANIYAKNKAQDTLEKEAGQNLRKATEIEKDLALAEKKNKE